MPRRPGGEGGDPSIDQDATELSRENDRMSELSSSHIFNPDWVERGKKMVRQEHESEESEMLLDGVIRHVVLDVIPDSPAARAGFRPGDIIVSVNGEPLPPGDSLRKMMQTWNGKSGSFRLRGVDGVERDVLVEPRWDDTARQWMLGLGYEHCSDYSTLFLEGLPQAERRVRMPIEIRNADNEIVATGHTVFGPLESYEERGEDGEKRKDEKKSQRIIERYVLSASRVGDTPLEYDVLARFNTTGVKAYWRPDMLTSGLYINADNAIALQNPTSPMAPHVIAHELRHANQRDTGRFAPLHSSLLPGRYRSVMTKGYDSNEYWTDILQSAGGIEAIREILSFLLSPDECEDLLAPVKERWEPGLNANRELRVAKRGIEEERERLQSDQQRRISGAKQNIFKAHLKSVFPADQFAEIRAAVMTDDVPKDPRTLLKSVHAVDNGREIDEQADLARSRKVFRELKKYIEGEKFADSLDQWPGPLDWSDIAVDPAAETLSLVCTDTKIGFRFHVTQEAIGALGGIMQTAEHAWVEERADLEYAHKIAIREFDEAAGERLRALERAAEDAPSPPTAQSEVLPGVRVIDILRLPTFLIERDAEYGALVALRAIGKETGINLFHSFLGESEMEADTQEAPATDGSISRRIETKIGSLRSIRRYMDRIGVPYGCLRTIRALRKSSVASNSA